MNVIDRDDDGNPVPSAGRDNIYLGTHGLTNGTIVRYFATGVALACSGGSSSASTGCVGGRLVNGGWYRAERL